MTLLKQVLSDLFKEIGWIVLYGFLAAMTVMTCILVGLSYKHVSGQNSAITRFIANDVSLLQIKSCDLNVPSSSMDELTSAYSEPSQGSTASFMDYFERAFSAEGILGSYVILPFDRDGFNNVIIYFGKYAELSMARMSPICQALLSAISGTPTSAMSFRTLPLLNGKAFSTTSEFLCYTTRKSSAENTKNVSIGQQKAFSFRISCIARSNSFPAANVKELPLQEPLSVTNR